MKHFFARIVEFIFGRFSATYEEFQAGLVEDFLKTNKISMFGHANEPDGELPPNGLHFRVKDCPVHQPLLMPSIVKERDGVLTFTDGTTMKVPEQAPIDCIDLSGYGQTFRPASNDEEPDTSPR